MEEAPDITSRLALSLLIAGLVGIGLWALGATVGQAVVDGALSGIAMLVCLSLLRGERLFLKLCGVLILLMTGFQAIGYAITYAIDGKGDLFQSWLTTISLAGALLLTPPIFSRLGLRRRTTLSD